MKSAASRTCSWHMPPRRTTTGLAALAACRWRYAASVLTLVCNALCAPAKHVVTAAEMEKVMNSLKIGPDTYVFAYDSDNGLFASRLVWTCWFYG